jgi:redox-sensitive bicupin YhaK (pirin superfamily)
MEIVTVVLEGEMTHQDSMGNKTVIKVGDVQRMSAGTGLTHSEYNLADVAVHFYQIWIYPDQTGLSPTYDQKRYDADAWRNRLFLVASGQNIQEAVTFHTDATIYRCELASGRTVTHEATAGRRIFVYLTEGQVTANGAVLRAKDQARIDVDEPLRLTAQWHADMILIDVPSCKGWGYSTETLKGQEA